MELCEGMSAIEIYSNLESLIASHIVCISGNGYLCLYRVLKFELSLSPSNALIIDIRKMKDQV